MNQIPPPTMTKSHYPLSANELFKRNMSTPLPNTSQNSHTRLPAEWTMGPNDSHCAHCGVFAFCGRDLRSHHVDELSIKNIARLTGCKFKELDPPPANYGTVAVLKSDWTTMHFLRRINLTSSEPCRLVPNIWRNTPLLLLVFDEELYPHGHFIAVHDSGRCCTCTSYVRCRHTWNLLDPLRANGMTVQLNLEQFSLFFAGCHSVVY